MDLINRYIHEVGRRLPKRMRADVETELHSLILDSLEERMSNDISESDHVPEEIQVAVLQEFGPPQKVANQYNPQINYIIGPRLFEPYLMTVAVVLGITFIARLVGILNLALNPIFAAGAIGDAVAGMIHSLEVGLGAITLIFALVERAIAKGKVKEVKSPWDPRKMPKISDHDRIKVSGLILETIFIAFFLVMLNFYPDRIGLSFVQIGGEFKMTSWLAPGFYKTYGVWLSIWWFIMIVLNIYVLWRGRWQQTTHLIHAALNFLGALLFYRIATGPNFILTAPGGLAGEVAGIPEILNDLYSTSIRGVVVLIAILLAFSAAKILYHLFQIKPVILKLQKNQG